MLDCFSELLYFNVPLSLNPSMAPVRRERRCCFDLDVLELHNYMIVAGLPLIQSFGPVIQSNPGTMT